MTSTNRYRIPLLQIRRGDGSLDFSKNCAQHGEYFIDEIEFNNSGSGANELVTRIYQTGAVVEMSAACFRSLTPLVPEQAAARPGPMTTPFLKVITDDNRDTAYVEASGGHIDIGRFVKMARDPDATLPVAIVIENNGHPVSANQMSQALLRKVNAGLYAQFHDGEHRHFVSGPLFTQALVSNVGYAFDDQIAALVPQTSGYGLSR